MLVNAKIKKAGLYYNGHYRYSAIRLELETRGGGGSVEFPAEKVGQLMRLFNRELDLENGVFLNDLAGLPVVLETSGDGYQTFVAIGDILANENELMPIEDLN